MIVFFFGLLQLLFLSFAFFFKSLEYNYEFYSRDVAL